MDPRFVESGATQYCSPIAGEGTKVLKASPGKLFYLRVANTTAAVRFAHVIDATTAAYGVPLIPPLQLPANSERELQCRFGLAGTIGISIASSTTQTAIGGAGANDLQISAIFK